MSLDIGHLIHLSKATNTAEILVKNGYFRHVPLKVGKFAAYLSLLFYLIALPLMSLPVSSINSDEL